MCCLREHEKASNLIKFIKKIAVHNEMYLQPEKNCIYLHLERIAQKITMDDILNENANAPNPVVAETIAYAINGN
jgi:hypothetical protein